MIFIFGYQPITKTIGPVEEVVCPNCHQEKHWLLQVKTNTISVFFLPLIPLKKSYLKKCPVCQFSQELTREDFQASEKLARLNAEALRTDMQHEEYEKRLASL